MKRVRYIGNWYYHLTNGKEYDVLEYTKYESIDPSNRYIGEIKIIDDIKREVRYSMYKGTGFGDFDDISIEYRNELIDGILL